jgi:LysR family transcriptional activator of nhaA
MHARQLNFKHLQYFHSVATEGSVSAAAASLHLTPQTISGQISQLEDALGQKLFVKVGRNLRLTTFGHKLKAFTDQIFTLGEQMLQELRENADGKQQNIVIGVVDSIPKIIAYEILKPLMSRENTVITCLEGDIERLMAELALQKLDMVLSDTPLNPAFSIRARTFLLGESSMSCFSTTRQAAKYRRTFPASLQDAPMLLPNTTSYVGRELHKWLEESGWRVNIRGYFEDSALLKVFGQAGEGLFFMPTVIEQAVCRQFNVRVVGRIDEIKERYYAIRPYQSVKNPALDMLCEKARTTIFDGSRE